MGDQIAHLQGERRGSKGIGADLCHSQLARFHHHLKVGAHGAKDIAIETLANSGDARARVLAPSQDVREGSSLYYCEIHNKLGVGWVNVGVKNAVGERVSLDKLTLRKGRDEADYRK